MLLSHAERSNGDYGFERGWLVGNSDIHSSFKYLLWPEFIYLKTQLTWLFWTFQSSGDARSVPSCCLLWPVPWFSQSIWFPLVFIRCGLSKLSNTKVATYQVKFTICLYSTWEYFNLLIHRLTEPCSPAGIGRVVSKLATSRLKYMVSLVTSCDTS